MNPRPSLPPLLALDSAEVHLWYVLAEQAADPALLQAYHGLLSAEEQARLQRFRFIEGQREFLITRALVRTVLSRYAAVEPRQWSFGVNSHGRPHIDAPEAGLLLRFNLSHSKGLVACAVARDREIGIDVEHMQRRNSLADIARRFFSAEEVQALEELPPEARQLRFFDFWTLKESYIKARGLGLALPLDQFSFHLIPSQPIRISFAPELKDDPASWQFAQFSLTAEHRTALAIRRGRDGNLGISIRQTVPLLAESV